jgi:hypothetical protein
LHNYVQLSQLALVRACSAKVDTGFAIRTRATKRGRAKQRRQGAFA